MQSWARPGTTTGCTPYWAAVSSAAGTSVMMSLEPVGGTQAVL
jgi:hypothetical protein